MGEGWGWIDAGGAVEYPEWVRENGYYICPMDGIYTIGGNATFPVGSQSPIRLRSHGPAGIIAERQQTSPGSQWTAGALNTPRTLTLPDVEVELVAGDHIWWTTFVGSGSPTVSFHLTIRDGPYDLTVDGSETPGTIPSTGQDLSGEQGSAGTIIPAGTEGQMLSEHQQHVTANSRAGFDEIGGMPLLNTYPHLVSPWRDSPNRGTRAWILKYGSLSSFSLSYIKGFRNEPVLTVAYPGVTYTAKAYHYADGVRGYSFDDPPGPQGIPADPNEHDTEAQPDDLTNRWNRDIDPFVEQYTWDENPTYNFKTRLVFLDGSGATISYVERAIKPKWLGSWGNHSALDVWNWIEVEGVSPAGTRYITVERGLTAFDTDTNDSHINSWIWSDDMSLIGGSYPAHFRNGTPVPDDYPGDGGGGGGGGGGGEPGQGSDGTGGEGWLINQGAAR